MSDFLPYSDWTPEGEGENEPIEVLRQKMLVMVEAMQALWENNKMLIGMVKLLAEHSDNTVNAICNLYERDEKLAAAINQVGTSHYKILPFIGGLAAERLRQSGIDPENPNAV